ncbi:MAG: hypothetical protein HYW27_00615 [Candidatus Aenigmarchaeota archaeon]|nr:hypothetical protein [Candidatus Aenigmarchaeota archaeon]
MNQTTIGLTAIIFGALLLLAIVIFVSSQAQGGSVSALQTILGLIRGN